MGTIGGQFWAAENSARLGVRHCRADLPALAAEAYSASVMASVRRAALAMSVPEHLLQQATELIS